MAWDINFKTDRPFREVDVAHALNAMPAEFAPSGDRPLRTLWGWRMRVDVLFDHDLGELIVSGEDEHLSLGSEFANRLASVLRGMQYDVHFDECQPSEAMPRAATRQPSAF